MAELRLFRRHRGDAPPSGTPARTLILLGQWGGIGFVLAAKSVARFKQLEANRHFAEVYLVGTTTSVVIAMATGALLRAHL